MVNNIAKKNRAGFTLVELMVTVSIISLISLIVFANHRGGEKQFALQRSAYKLAQDIRKAQSMAMATREIGRTVPKGYGIYLDTANRTQYILFADLNGNKRFDAASERVETLEFERGVGITGLSPCSPLTFVFSPPDPDIMICVNPANNLASISLNFEGGQGKIIKVNKVGLIEIK